MQVTNRVPQKCFVFTIHLLLCVIGTVKGQGSPDCFEQGECMDSLLLDIWHEVGDAQSCLEQCQQDSDCEFFTFYEEDNSCLTFANCVTFSTDSCSSCYSGERSCEGLECWVEGFCNGVLVGETLDVDQNSCLEDCQAHDDCLWFTHDSDGDICLMFQDCSTLDVSCDTCLSGQTQCSPFETDLTSYTKIFVIGGLNYDYHDGFEGHMRHVEAIDLGNPGSTCNAISEYPVEESGMAVGIIDGLIKACGGSSNTDDCYDYSPATNSWITSASMFMERSNPKASFIDGNWFVSGDSSFDYDVGDITETWTGSGFDQGPNLPIAMYAPCQLTVNSTHVFFADTFDTLRSFLLDWGQQAWTELPQMTIDRYVSSCGLINNPENGIEAVIVEKGITEIFNFGSLTWRMGPSLPYFNLAGSAQLNDDTFVVVGGRDEYGDPLDTIYMFDHINYEWILNSQRLQIARENIPAVVAVPDDFVSCS